MKLRTALVWTLLSAAAAGAQAQSVWRCGADGKQFSDKPCEQGRVLDATLEPRPAQDLAAAQDAARREKALAAQLVKERQQREAQAPKAAAGIRMAKAEDAVKPKAVPKPKRQAKHHPADDGIWRATAPSSRQTKG